jgi:hypothetical protein
MYHKEGMEDEGEYEGQEDSFVIQRERLWNSKEKRRGKVKSRESPN